MLIRSVKTFFLQCIYSMPSETRVILNSELQHQLTVGKMLTSYRSVRQSPNLSSLTASLIHSFINGNLCFLIGDFKPKTTSLL